MNFRSVNDLFTTVRTNKHRFPSNIDLVVGVPRSGILAACAVSLAMHKPLTDLNSFVEGRVHEGFSRRPGLDTDQLTGKHATILVVDDSIYSGGALREARRLIEAAGIQQKVIYAAIFGLDTSHHDADLVLETCPSPRVFEWNVLNHWSLEYSCVDLDGVICADPTILQNDDGPAYLEFLATATLLNAPKYPINSIVTSRLERYRPQTKAWLEANRVTYKNLYMLDLPSAEERRRLGAHAKFKSEIFKSRRDCLLFIESDIEQAHEIRVSTGKSVLAYQDMKFFAESGNIKSKRNFRQFVGRMLPSSAKRYLKKTLGV